MEDHLPPSLATHFVGNTVEWLAKHSFSHYLDSWPSSTPQHSDDQRKTTFPWPGLVRTHLHHCKDIWWWYPPTYILVYGKGFTFLEKFRHGASKRGYSELNCHPWPMHGSINFPEHMGFLSGVHQEFIQYNKPFGKSHSQRDPHSRKIFTTPSTPSRKCVVQPQSYILNFLLDHSIRDQVTSDAGSAGWMQEESSLSKALTRPRG